MQPHNQSFKHALKLSIIYFIPGILWIYFSDNLVASIASDNSQLILMQMHKGWFFIAFTTFILFIVSYYFSIQQFKSYQQYLNEQNILQIKLDKQHSLLKSIIDSSPDAIFAKDSEGRYLIFNQGASNIVNIPVENVLGKTDSLLFSTEAAQQIYEEDRSILYSKSINTYEEILTTVTGDEKTFLVTKGPLYTPEGNIFGLFGISRDITERSLYEQKILEEKEKFDSLAHHDTLTQLPNRLSLFEYTTNRILQPNPEPFSLLFLDLDGFQQINDSYGHRFGDKLLIEVSLLLQHIFPPDSFIVRTGGDEFVIIVSCQIDIFCLTSLLNRLIETLSLPFQIDGLDIYTTASIGSAQFPNDATSTEDLLQCADAAMYEAKKSGKNNYRLYNPSFTQKALLRTTMSNNLKKALRENQLSLHYQPQVDAKSQKIIGYEALIRWESDEGFIPPSTFIPICEESGLIQNIGEFVLLEGCKTAVKWAKEGILHGHIAINVSAYQLIHPNFLSILDDIINTTKCDPSTIELEITETSILENPEKIIALLGIIKSRGFKISIDDFGTGYSSLSYLKNLPIDKLKIDISFVRNITLEPKNQTIVKTIISLAKGLRMEVLAEGVETNEELTFLCESGIDSIQGFYFYQPMPLDTIERLLKAEKL